MVSWSILLNHKQTHIHTLHMETDKKKSLYMCEVVVKVISISSLIFAHPQALRSIK